MVLRVVGYLEYRNALRNLDQLLTQLNEVEIEQLDQYIRRRDEFEIVTGVSPELARGNSSLAGMSGVERERRGLPWVLALARIELGSMFAAFTNTPRPFEAVIFSDYDLPEYATLLWDDLQTHYGALHNDPQIAMLPRSSNIPLVLSYSRRLILVRALLRVAVRANSDRIGPLQEQELYSWNDSLDRLQEQLMAKINAYVGVAAQSSKKTVHSVDSVILSRYCGQIARAEEREIAEGTATVTHYPPISAGPQR